MPTKISTITRQNLFTHSIDVDSPILMYSSVASTSRPYASIRTRLLLFEQWIVLVCQAHHLLGKVAIMFFLLHQQYEEITRHSKSSGKHTVILPRVVSEIVDKQYTIRSFTVVIDDCVTGDRATVRTFNVLLVGVASE